jgi:hypothetical protein
MEYKSGILGKHGPLDPGDSLPVLLGTDIPLRFSKHPPPFIYSIFFENHTHSYIFPLKILTQLYIS